MEINALDPTPPIKIAANLPYNVGTELLVRWLTPAIWPPVWSSLTLMFQREVAGGSWPRSAIITTAASRCSRNGAVMRRS